MGPDAMILVFWMLSFIFKRKLYFNKHELKKKTVNKFDYIYVYACLYTHI